MLADGSFNYDLESFEMAPCLDIYGDDPELKNFFNDVYENTPEHSTTGWICFKPTNDVIV